MVKLTGSEALATKCVHAGVHPDPVHGAVNPAIQLSTTFVQPEPARPLTFDYSRAGNPTRQALEEAIAVVEGGVSGHAFASGLSALDGLIRTLDAGAHIVAAEDAYGGSIRLLNKVCSRQGISVTFVDTQDPAKTAKAMTKKTRMVLLETPTNPLLRVSDIKANAEVAHDGGAILVVDNTFMSPALQNPIAHGADAVFHSATKYIGGHSDVLGGVVATADKELGERLRFIQLAVGAVLAPMDCFLLLRGLKTLDLRMQRHNATAAYLAAQLGKHKAVSKVFYPGAAKHPNSRVHARQARGGGGMLSFQLADLEAARACVTSTRLFQLAESLGAVESLIQLPALMTHASVPKEMRQRTGLEDGLIRVSPGIEDPKDLWDDLKQAIEASA